MQLLCIDTTKRHKYYKETWLKAIIIIYLVTLHCTLLHVDRSQCESKFFLKVHIVCLYIHTFIWVFFSNICTKKYFFCHSNAFNIIDYFKINHPYTLWYLCIWTNVILLQPIFFYISLTSSTKLGIDKSIVLLML